MIKSFQSGDAHRIYEGDYSGKKIEKMLPRHLMEKAKRLLVWLDLAKQWGQLSCYGLKDLVGDRQGFKSIQIDKQYRIVFRVDSDFNKYDVDIEDYH